ncbi:LOW QUALITY PROTEIN: huntingtin-interacting protein 1-like [Branchiostoma floridae]|uniref:Huntingtin-interacting protein 1-related protein n=1 Tax=Branchiostoma floridae TaxID=7739 RepID=A0A9J7LXZ5_BRAFL|nr:LOW QUALITY PROTEIN: huntingtin-interacting protein 1-like [Branchiostoma floridae]
MSISMSRVLSRRQSSNSLDAERQNFERFQALSINKAINPNEVPVKEKHCRSTIIGTHQEKGAATFWKIVNTLPLQGNAIVCWKFCHVLHKLLREGHSHALTDTYKYVSHLADLGRLWGHLQEGYGKLIALYCKLLVTKIEFHRKNAAFPGNLQMSDEQLHAAGENDVNNYFQLTVEMFDYMDSILAMQAAVLSSVGPPRPLTSSVFATLDPTRSNSMTSTGQCRIAPLMPLILDSSHLYEFILKLMFKLHSCLPSDVLDGHRDRFLHQFHALKKFYHAAGKLQFFPTMLQVPQLPEEPPNFLLHCQDYSEHIAPVVVLPQAQSPDTDSLVDTDISPQTPSDLLQARPPQEDRRFEEVFGSDDLGTFQFNQTQNGAHENQFFPELQFVKLPEKDSKDIMIEQLQKEIQQLKQQMEYVQEQDQRIISSMNMRIRDLEFQLQQNMGTVREIREDNKLLVAQLERGGAGAQMQQRQKSDELEKQLKESEKRANKSGKVTKMKDVYTKLREEHIVLLRKSAEVERQLTHTYKSKDETEAAKKTAEEFAQRLQSSMDEKKSEEEAKTRQLLTEQLSLLVSAVEEGEHMVRGALDKFDDPLHAQSTSTAEYLISRAQSLLGSLDSLGRNYNSFTQNKKVTPDLVRTVTQFSHLAADTILQGKAASHMAPLEQGEDLAERCKGTGEKSLVLLGSLRQQGSAEVTSQQVEDVKASIQDMITCAQELIPKIADIKSELGDLVETEMSETTEAVDKAAAKIEEMLNKSRQGSSGVRLEVNEKILDSCTELMKAIKQLIIKSKDLQNDIVAQGRGTATAQEFYNRNPRWTEGLVSAAKTVGWGATVLTDAADKVIQGTGKFEELVVCSHEIAASSAQLVAASKVKAEKNSATLKELRAASKGVANATANVVATTKSGQAQIEESDTMDFSAMSLTTIKRLEMDSQVHVLELESSLTKERQKLSDLRKKHYQLAGVSEGWEEEDILNCDVVKRQESRQEDAD